ncbi:MAG TPA: hypothetical protein DD643_00970 [Synechococcus sp. UBA8638]|nr:hypothetical protein [Synechococcus sp. UBA8638]
MANHEAPAASGAPQFGPPNVRLKVEDFGPLKQASVELRPLTVFVGPSNTGKTYLALLIYALHRVFESRDIDSFASELLSDLKRCLDVKSGSELIRNSSSDNFRVSLKVSDVSKDLCRFILKFYNETFHLENIILEKDNQNIRLNTRNHEILRRLQKYPRSEQSDKIYLQEWYKFLRVLVKESIWLGKVFYLPAVRSGIMQSYPIIASALATRTTRPGVEVISQLTKVPTLSGSFTDFMQELILYDRPHSSSRGTASEHFANLATDLERQTLSGEIRIARSTTGGYPEFVYRPQGTEQDIRLNRASSMVSELAPIILFMRRIVKPGDTLIIEEPEAHLHPAAQTRMAKNLAALVRAGVRVLVTTHSDWLLQEMANLVREGELRQAQGEDPEADASDPWLDPQEVGVWLFKDSEDGGGATVQEIPFDRVDGLEPEDYADVAETLYNDSAQLQNQLEAIRMQGGK